MRDFLLAAPGNVRTQQAFGQNRQWTELDLDRERGAIRGGAHAISRDGGLAVLYANLAPDGCIITTASVDDSLPPGDSAWRDAGSRLARRVMLSVPRS